MALATSLVVLFYWCATADILTKILQQIAPCFSLLWLYLGNSQVSVYRTICPSLVYCCATADIMTKLLQQCFLFFIVLVIPGRAFIGPLVLLWFDLMLKVFQLFFMKKCRN